MNKSKQSNKLVNFYDLAGVKKYQPKSHNPHYKDTNIPIPSRCALIGSTGAGKTSILLNFLLLAQDTFIHIFVVYKEMEPLYKYLGDKLKEDVTFLKNLKDLPTPEDLEYTDLGNVLLVIDDQVAEKDQTNVKNYFLMGRKVGHGITICYLSQSFYAIPKFIRQQLNILLIVKVGSKRDLAMILKDYSVGVDIDTLTKFYKEATKEFPSFFKINLQAPPNEMFSKNFTDFMILPEE